MKNIVAFSVWLTLCVAAPTLGGGPEATAAPTGEKVAAEVEGIRWLFWAYNVKAAVSRLEFAPPAQEMQVDIEAGRLEFTTRPGTKLDPERFRDAIGNAGYGVGAITVDGRPVTDTASDPERGPGPWGHRAMMFVDTVATYAWATFTYLVGYRFVIGLAPAASILAQASWSSKPRYTLRRSHLLFGPLSGITASPTGRGVRGALATAAETGPRAVVAAVSGAHFLTAYPLLLLGPLLGKDVLLSHVIGVVLLTAMTALAWHPARVRPSKDSANPSPDIRRVAVRELSGVGPHVLLGLFAGGVVAAWGLSPLRIELATALGGGLSAQIGSAIVGTALGSASCLPPVASLFVATYLWKTGIAHAGLVSFLLAAAATPLRRRLYRRELGEREGARLWWILLVAGPLAGIATALLFRLLGLGIQYRLTPEQLL